MTTLIFAIEDLAQMLVEGNDIDARNWPEANPSAQQFDELIYRCVRDFVAGLTVEECSIVVESGYEYPCYRDTVRRLKSLGYQPDPTVAILIIAMYKMVTGN
jgi:hypothetical protein